MHGTSKKLSTQLARVPHTEVPDRNIGVPPVRKYATFRTLSKGPITWRTFNPGVELSPVNRVEIFCDYMDDFNPGVETLYYTFSASIRGG